MVLHGGSRRPRPDLQRLRVVPDPYTGAARRHAEARRRAAGAAGGESRASPALLLDAGERPPPGVGEGAGGARDPPPAGSASRSTASSRGRRPDPEVRGARRRAAVASGRTCEFPELDAGNISYKLTERLAARGGRAPLRGWRRRSTTSRAGCSAEDIVDVIGSRPGRGRRRAREGINHESTGHRQRRPRACLCWKLAAEPAAHDLYCAPGNTRHRRAAEPVPLAPEEVPRLGTISPRDEVRP